MKLFNCENCKHYRKEGWPAFVAAGGPINSSPCRQYGYLKLSAARAMCKGVLFESQIEERAEPATPSDQPAVKDA